MCVGPTEGVYMGDPGNSEASEAGGGGGGLLSHAMDVRPTG